ncbi:hypothetical protein FEM48_Zijuj12G0093100 [Ziziphus jujuba var. spinosa]|uniref:Myb-like domain-containing protein n=1 Tax=Ziziphus jujuba var. spinosa TaxID=714518 RepID=A0A978UCG7_ZIZJJ|nr:hypothetical protein FEM48_Zijuj12G0093100 [Ziziphus jujuba var. spinosa]
MLQLFFAIAFSAVPLTLYVPPIRSLNLFVESVENIIRQTTIYTLRAYPRIRLGCSRIFNALFHLTSFRETVSMDNMPDSESVAWLWVIEAIASFKEVGPSLLYDLVKTAPKLPDNLGKNTRERIALRCLEALFVPCNGNTSDVPSVQGSKVRFELSESCEDVLQRILQETSVSDLRTAGQELSKWDIYPFIMHKRACMREYTLGQLKDAILDGTHSYADFLGEKSGLALKKGADRTSLKDNHSNSLSFKPNQSCSDVQTVRLRGNSDPPILENKNKELEENLHDGDRNKELENNLHDGDILVSKRGRVNFSNGDLAPCDDHYNIDVSNDQCINSKKVKLHVSPTFQLITKNPVPLHETEHAEDSTVREVLVSEREGCDLAENQIGTVEEGMVVEDGCNEYILLKRGEQSDGNDAFHKSQSEIHCNDAVMPKDSGDDETQHNLSVDEAKGDGKHPADPRNAPPIDGSLNKSSSKESKFDSEHDSQLRALNPASQNGYRQNIIAGEAEENMDCCQEAGRSSNSDGYQSEGIDVITKKHEFLSSQCTIRHSSSTVDEWTGLNLCMKCNEGGQLLACKSSSCPLLLHENCLGSAARFDDKGDFYCPFCAYSRAITEYLESKKKTSLAKKELDAFIRAGSKKQTTEFIGKLSKKENSCTKVNGEVDFLNKTHENKHSGQREENQENQDERHASKVYDVQFQKFIVDKQQADPSASCNNVSLECEENRTSLTCGMPHGPTGEEKGEEEVVKECTTARGHEEQPNQVVENSGNVVCENSDMIVENQEPANERIQQEVLKEHITDTPEKPVPVFVIDNNEDEISEDDESVISNYRIRVLRTGKQYTYPIAPQSRRKKAPWTTTEEELLMEGVKKFSSASKRAIPWTEILEFGSSVFLKGRTAMDLKDKWRNMSKGFRTPK